MSAAPAREYSPLSVNLSVTSFACRDVLGPPPPPSGEEAYTCAVQRANFGSLNPIGPTSPTPLREMTGKNEDRSDPDQDARQRRLSRGAPDQMKQSLGVDKPTWIVAR